uniref:NADH-ubiquinone oxidoreductase chain 3 n=1 Tax=Karaftohelix adamsi TaxID=2013957 RepID=A0A8J9R319_9EUPU|nr:NADH dehydrogenase subunit 3 [Karaftohelix adamsi]
MLYYCLVSVSLCILFSMTFWLVGFQSSNSASVKTSPFECGFEGYTSMRRPFSIRYFVLIVLFLIFDVEAVLLFPCLTTLLLGVNLNMYFYMFLFILLLTLGLTYEWKNGMLDWL